MVSPGTNEADRVVYAVRSAETFSGSFETWFTQRIPVLAGKLGQASRGSALSWQNGTLFVLFIIQGFNGAKARACFLGYDVGDKGEIIIVLIPQGVSDRDPREVTALAHARLLADRKVVLAGRSWLPRVSQPCEEELWVPETGSAKD